MKHSRIHTYARGWCQATLGCLLLMAGAFAAQAAERVALVIGNSKYPGGNELANPANDADSLATKLEGLNFVVLKKMDLSAEDMSSALREFRNQISPQTEVAMFFFAGHGIQIEGVNYLLPIGKFEAAFEVKTDAMKADKVLAAMEEAGARRNVVVLDCCRNNPFARSINRGSRSAGASEGLKPIDQPPPGTLIAFSTKAGTTASDGVGTNSPYTETLLEVLDERPGSGLELKRLFNDVAGRVFKKTKQDPFIYSSGSFGEYFLVEGSSPDVPGNGGGTNMVNDAERRRLETENQNLKLQLAEISKKLDDGKVTNELLEQLKFLQTRMNELDERMQETPAAPSTTDLATVPTAPSTGGTLPVPNIAVNMVPAQRGVSPFMFPDSDSRIITDAELSSLGADDLWIARNEMFARHGYIFQTGRGRSLAQSLGGFYSPVSGSQDYIYSQMNQVEKANVDRIKRYEGR